MTCTNFCYWRSGNDFRKLFSIASLSLVHKNVDVMLLGSFPQKLHKPQTALGIHEGAAEHTPEPAACPSLHLPRPGLCSPPFLF